MTDERSTEATWRENPGQKEYDLRYYDEILPLTHGNVLDLGCGIGLLSAQIALRPNVTKVLGVDLYPAAERFQHEKIWHHELDLNQGIGTMEQFDCIVSTEFIEHITKESFLHLLADIREILKSGGIFCGSTPNKVEETTNQYHLYEYTLNELEEILKRHFGYVEIRDIGGNCMIWKAIKK